MTERLSADIAIVGAGVGGSLLALLLNRIGFRVVLLDRGRHPRFAIGESSTPIADLVLRDLARRYALPRLAPLSRFGTWKQTYPQLTCGLKRGFSYFHQRAGQPFLARADHGNELLVAASRDDAHADTHWLRSDVDSFLANEVQDAGIPYFDQTEITIREKSPTWQLAGNRPGMCLDLRATFLVDASGTAAFLPQALSLKNMGETMRTRSRAIFAHFERVAPWQELLAKQGADTQAHPFRCDASALHQLLEEGWMWQLRFENGVTSAGFVLETTAQSRLPTISPEEEWQGLLDRYPSLHQQFASARRVAPATGLRRTGRLQRRWERMTGTNWALLPHTAGFVDPLYSVGLAQTLCGVERLAHLLEHHWRRESLHGYLQQYANLVELELDLIDELVEGSYAARHIFDLFVPFSMLYFAAATTYEQQRLQAGFQPGRACWCANDANFRRIVRHLRRKLRGALAHAASPDVTHVFFRNVANAIAPYNSAGLCDPEAANMYRYTAVDLP